jgi:disulfide bond formation protein DsbB
MITLQTTNYLLALGTIGMQAATLALFALYVFRNSPELASSMSVIREWAMRLAFLVSVLGSAFTLFYSEILGIPPCPFCWIQRAFLYPQIALFAFALWRSDARIARASIVLSMLGLGVALYHHALQMFPDALPCLAQGAVCAQRHIFEFGYITFPLMAVSLFAFLIVLMLFSRVRSA